VAECHCLTPRSTVTSQHSAPQEGE
jgi:hypothetical protein